MNGTYAVPYVANAAGVLYNRGMFQENGWEIPETWEEFKALCDTIQAAGIQPLYFGFKDTWNCLAPWNAIAVDLAPADVCSRVNRGETTFTEQYREVAERMLELLPYGQKDPFSYGYNDACTAFARGPVSYTHLDVYKRQGTACLCQFFHNISIEGHTSIFPDDFHEFQFGIGYLLNHLFLLLHNSLSA